MVEAKDILDWVLSSYTLHVVLGVSIALILAKLVANMAQSRKLQRLREEWNKVGHNVVVLHQFPRPRGNMPSPSPYPLKVETFLRMANIKYVSDFDQYVSSKGKTPWITMNGEDMADSQLSIEWLSQKLGIDLMANVSPENRGIARAVRALVEDNYYWIIVTERFVHSDLSFVKNFFAPLPIPGFLVNFAFKHLGKKIKAQANAQGMARHSKADIQNIGVSDLEAISNILGNKPFLCGEEPCMEDATLFGFLCVVFFGSPDDSVYGKTADDKFPNLRAYVERMKERYWPDWEEHNYQKMKEKEKASKESAASNNV